jgi:hypothetical protein
MPVRRVAAVTSLSSKASDVYVQLSWTPFHGNSMSMQCEIACICLQLQYLCVHTMPVARSSDVLCAPIVHHSTPSRHENACNILTCSYAYCETRKWLTDSSDSVSNTCHTMIVVASGSLSNSPYDTNPHRLRCTDVIAQHLRTMLA